MKKSIEKYGSPFTVFGGEPLLIPNKDLEEIFSWGYNISKRNSIQTNGTLINDDHIDLFKRFKVSVGISIDGPGELNDLRFLNNKEVTREYTKKTELAIERLLKEKIPLGLIVTLHRLNADSEHLPILINWIKNLDKLNLRSMRLHLLESESEEIRTKYSLSIEENVNAFYRLMHLENKLNNLKFDIFYEMTKMLLGADRKSTCILRGCDPYTTDAVSGIEGDGQSSNCGRTNKNGINYVKSDTKGFERYISLYNTPQKYGGCKGCKFFLMCKGNCPGTSIAGDWRNRSEHCEIWKRLYRKREKLLKIRGIKPISSDKMLRKYLEKQFMIAWANGKNTTMHDCIQKKINC